MSNRQAPFKSLKLAIAATSVFCVAAGAAPQPYQLQLWNDPVYKKLFLREYVADTATEPPLSETERQQMEKLRLFMMEKPLESMRALEEVTTATSSAEFDYILGQLSVQANQPLANAVGHYLVAVKKFPSFRRAHYALGRLYTQDGKYDLAVKSLAKAMELGRADAVLFGLLAFCHLAEDHAGSAESAYRTALVIQPESIDWKMGLVRALLKQGKADEVIALTDEMIAADPGKAELWALQSNAFIAKKDYLRAATNLEMVARHGTATPQDFVRLGDIYLNEQLPDAALSAYERALKDKAALPLTDAVRIVEATSARGANSQARELLGAVRTSYASALGEPDKRRLMKVEARLSVAEGEGGKSVEILEEVIQLDPLDGDALMLLAQHYANSGEKERAVLYYQRAEGVEAFEADASVKHAQLLAGMGRLDQAIPLLKRAQQLKPRESVAKFLEELERYQKQKR